MKLSDGILEFVISKQNSGIAFTQRKLMLLRFKKQIGDLELNEITTQDVMRFLDVSSVRPYTWHAKHNLLRRLFEYWSRLGVMPPLPMPPKRVPVRSSFLPYVFNHSEIRRLLEGTSQSQANGSCSLEAKPLRMMLFILFSTGATLREIVQLKRGDLDLKRRIVTVCDAQRRGNRNIPLNADVCRVLRSYLKWRSNSLPPHEFLFVRKSGRCVDSVSIQRHFRRLVRRCGVRRRDGIAGWPRISDFRTSFAVHRIAEWLEQGANLNRMLPALAAYLGQSGMNSIDRYLRLTPERFRKQLISLSPKKGRRHWRDDESLMRFLASL